MTHSLSSFNAVPTVTWIFGQRESDSSDSKFHCERKGCIEHIQPLFFNFMPLSKQPTMKQAACLALITFAIATMGQAQVKPALASLVQAENDFARMSVEENMRAAFIANFDDQTIAFRNGEPILGRKEWVDGKANDYYLFWWPI